MNMAEEIRRLRRQAADHQTWREVMTQHLAWLRQRLERTLEDNAKLREEAQHMRTLLDDYAKAETGRHVR